MLKRYGIQYSEDHHRMILEYMDKAATDIRILNGNKFDNSYYMAWVWEGLSQYLLPSDKDKFPVTLTNSWNDKRKIVNSNSPWKCQ